MQPPSPQQSARWQRLLAACRRGLNHDLSNQLVALQGLLGLLQKDEEHRLTSAGQEYVARLMKVGQRTLALADTLRDLCRLGDDLPPPEVVALPQLADEVLSQTRPPAAHRAEWAAPSVWAPRELLRQALTVALAAVKGNRPDSVGFYKFQARPEAGAIQWTISASPSEGANPLPASPANATFPVGSAPRDRLDLVLLRELAEACGGTVLWRAESGEVAVVLTLPKPPASAGP
jgi:hypothetical protein